MQSTSTPLVTSAASQTPLLQLEQLRVGIYLTGIDMTYLWELMSVESGPKGALLLQRYPKPLVQPGPGHQCAFVAQGRGSICQCGLRKSTAEEFMPLKAGKARVQIIQPLRELVQPRRHAIYAGVFASAVKTVGVNTTWNQPLPIVPELMEIWAPPPALQALLDGSPEIAEEIE